MTLDWDEVLARGNSVAMLCQRTDELPRPYVPSRRARCAGCGDEVWVSMGTLDFAEESGRELLPICPRHQEEAMAAATSIVPMVPQQVDEIRRARGEPN